MISSGDRECEQQILSIDNDEYVGESLRGNWISLGDL